MPDLWAGLLIGGLVSAAVMLMVTADWEYHRARWRGQRNLRKASRPRRH